MSLGLRVRALNTPAQGLSLDLLAAIAAATVSAVRCSGGEESLQAVPFRGVAA